MTDISKRKDYPEKILATMKSALHQSFNAIKAHLNEVVENRLDAGEGQRPYSTRPAWYSLVKPYGSKGKFVSYLTKRGLTIRTAQSRVAWKFPYGYAEWRSIWRGEKIKAEPVTFNLTGQLRKAFKIVGRTNKAKGQAWFTASFSPSRRRDGRLTNDQLAEIHNRRSPGAAPFAMSEQDADDALKYFDQAVKTAK